MKKTSLTGADKQAADEHTRQINEKRADLARALEASSLGPLTPEQLNRATLIADDIERTMRLANKTGPDPFSRIMSATRTGRTILNEQLKDVTTDKSITSDERFRKIQEMQARNTAVPDALMQKINAMGPKGVSVLSEFERNRTRQERDIASANRTIMQHAGTEFRQNIEIQSAPTYIDDTGSMRTRGVAERLSSLAPQAEKLQGLLQTEKAADKQSLIKQQLTDLYSKKRQLSITGTRDSAVSIAEKMNFTPVETSPGMWSSPSLSAQRNTAQVALKEAQQLKSALGTDALPEQQKQANDLLKKMVDQLARIDNGIQQGQKELAGARVSAPIISKLMNRNDGEDDSSFAGRIAQRSGVIKGVGAAVFNTAAVATQTIAAIKAMTFDMPGRTTGVMSSSEGGLQNQFLESLTYGAQSRARFGGDILFKDPTLGRSGYAMAGKAATAELERRRSADEWALKGQGASALLGGAQLLGGVAAIAAGGLTGIGAPLGLMAGSSLIAGGIGTLTGAFTGAAGNTAAQESGKLDFAGPFSGYAAATRQAQFQQARDMFMNQSLERNKVGIAAQDAYGSNLDAFAQNIRSAGAWAVEPADLVRQTQKQTWNQTEGGFVREFSKLTGVDVPGKTTTDLLTGGESRRIAEQQSIQEQSQQNLEMFSSKYGMTAGEWASKVGGVSSRMGVGVGKTTADQRQSAAERLYGMGLVGLGSFEQVSANAESMANLTGRTDSTVSLEKIMSKAVKTGFDDSRTGQSFIQSSISVANALGLRGDVSERLSMGTRLMGGTEQDMAATARGMMQLPQEFDRNKMLGGVNFASFLAGGGLGQDAVTAQNTFDISKNPDRYLKAQSDIVRVRSVIGSKGGDNREKIMSMLDSQEFKDIDPAVRDALFRGGVKGLDQFSESAGSGLKSIAGITGADERIKGLMSTLNNSKLTTKQKRFEVGAAVRDASALAPLIKTGMDIDTASTAYQAALMSSMTPAQRGIFDKYAPAQGDYGAQKAEAEKKAQEAATIRRNEVASQAALITQGRTTAKGGLTADDIRADADGKFRFAAGGKAMEISGDRAKAIMKGGSAEGGAESEFKKWAETTNKLQASLQTQMFSSLESVLSGRTQEVYVKNWEGLAAVMDTVKQLDAAGGGSK